MSWTTLLWTVLLWTGYIYPSSGDPTFISYNWYDFLQVSAISWRFDRGSLDLSTYNKIGTHWMWFDQAYIKNKVYVVDWLLRASTSELLETAIDEMVRACSVPNQLLKIRRKSL